MPTKADQAGKDDFHRERSRFLDAFAALEEALSRAPNGTKDKQLAEVIKSLKTIRNDLVHSQLRFVQLEGQLHAVCINVQASDTVARPCRLVRIDDFSKIAAQINTAKQKLDAA
jgi:hypothetical protein